MNLLSVSRPWRHNITEKHHRPLNCRPPFRRNNARRGSPSRLTRVGFLGDLFPFVLACTTGRLAFAPFHPLSLPLFLPLLQLCRRQCAGDRKVLRPCLWPQGRFWPRLPEADGGDQAQASTGDTTQFASAWPLRPAARRLPGHMSRRQLLALLGWAADLRLTAYPHHPQGTDGQGQPQAGSTIGVEHLGMMPAPLPPFVVLEAPFNPSAQAIPRAVDLMGRQISDHDPRL